MKKELVYEKWYIVGRPKVRQIPMPARTEMLLSDGFETEAEAKTAQAKLPDALNTDVWQCLLDSLKPPEPEPTNVYAVRDSGHYLFFQNDPAADGYTGSVVRVALDYDFESVHRWPVGSESPEPWLGVKQSTKHLKVFGSEAECDAAGYFLMGPQFQVLDSWRDWLKLRGPN